MLLAFETAAFLCRRDEISAGNVNILLKLWESSLAVHEVHAPFRNHTELYDLIDEIPYGDIPWKQLAFRHPDAVEEGTKPGWMEEQHVVWCRDPMQALQELISNPDFKNEFDYILYHDYNSEGHRFQNVMSGNWAWTVRPEFYHTHLQVHSYLQHRISLGKIPVRGALFLCQLFSAVIKQRCQLQLETVIIGRYISQLGTYTTGLAEATGMASW